MGSDLRKSGRKKKARVVSLPCACASLRRTARLVTQYYEQAMPSGVTGPQFTLLQALKLAPGISQNQLATILGMDSTTLTRSLALLRKQGWLGSEPGTDRRVLRLRLTQEGEKEYERVLPHWQSAQKRFKKVLGDENWNNLLNAIEQTAEAIQFKK